MREREEVHEEERRTLPRNSLNSIVCSLLLPRGAPYIGGWGWQACPSPKAPRRWPREGGANPRAPKARAGPAGHPLWPYSAHPPTLGHPAPLSNKEAPRPS
jgi:hypothetical protein